MKKILLLITCLLVISVNIIAQDNNISSHLIFKNIPIDGKLDEFVAKLENEGFSVNDKFDAAASLSGEFVNKQCTILVCASPKTKIAYMVIVTLPEDNSWRSLKRDYFNFKEQYEKKYGKTNDSENYFSKPYYEGDGYELQALKNEKCSYRTRWNLKEGKVMVHISSDCKIPFVYMDNINRKIYDSECQSKVQDDI
ncbi:hypothetical protein EZS27_030871 [termite gut metagenome]|uniref:Uncharacterized protein n=1 Tax=termite gut metagenome TaxID=433724 RepID=A0A5J4QC13_9ZZZZ